MAGKLTYSITTTDGKTHQVSRDNIDKYGIESYAEAYQGATVRMRDEEGSDYDIPLQHFKAASDKGLRPFVTNHGEPVKPGSKVSTKGAVENTTEAGLSGSEAPAQDHTSDKPATAGTEATAPVQKWEPTEQEKIQAAYQLNTGLREFNARSRQRVEQAKRSSDFLTREGRERIKTGQFQAQIAGMPTKVLGLTSGAGLSATEVPAENQDAGNPEASMGWLSGQGPVVYGVVMEDGERKRQWLLPDGRLTTYFAEADHAEYGARKVRLRNQFVKRMRANGLDPSNKEDVAKQAQIDYETPIREAVAAAVAADEERNLQEQEAYLSNPLNMIGGVMGNLGRSSARKQAGIGDLTKIAEGAYSSLPSWYRNEMVASYRGYFAAHPEALHGKSIEQAAKDAAKSEVYRQVHETYVERNAPKSATEFFFRKIVELNPASVALSNTVNPSGQAYADMDAMERYGAEHRGLDIAGLIAGMAMDPITYMSGGVGNYAMRRALGTASRFMAKKAAGKVAERLTASTLTGRVAGSMAGVGANFLTFETSKDIERQLYQGGYVNPESGEIENFSVGSVINSGVHGLALGAATGMVSPLIGNVADKAVKATSSTAGKAVMRGSEVLTSTLVEGTIFSIPEWINGEKDAMDVWTDNMAMMAGFKLSHGMKVAPQFISSLRPFKPKDGRPLTKEERIHNNRSFAERIQEFMDSSPSNLRMTKDEKEELRQYGYGELSDLFSFDPEHKSRKAPQAQTVEGDYVGVKGLSRVVDYEPRLEENGNPDFDGYEAMERLMEDKRVSEATRAKAYYILTGRSLPPSTITGWTREDLEDGSIIISSTNVEGTKVTRRRYKSEAEAEIGIEEVQRQVELNTIDVGEQYREAEAEFYGRESVRPQAIRERISKEIGIDVDKAIRKEPWNRSEKELEAVNRYVKELFPEEEVYEPTPEQTEADRIYEESRRLFGRMEHGDPEAKADYDVIAIRMQDAYQYCEDVFGAESEAYISQLESDPWGVLNNPELTPEQKEAALYYINSKSALEGVLDASNESAQSKKQKVQDEVAHRTHKERGVIVPATMKLDDRPTYIIKGDVAMFPDGSGVDVRNSSDAIIILDEQGEYKFVSPDQIMSVGETIDPQIELQTAYEAIDREQEAIIGAATGGVPEMPENVPYSTVTPANGTKTDAETPQSVPNVEEYDRGNEEGNNAEQNIPDNIPEGEAEASPLSKIPVSEETGDPLLTHESVDAETAWDAALEFFGTPEDALNYVQSEVRNAKTAITAAEKGVSKVKPTGGMTKYRDDLAKARAQVEASKSNLAKWEAIAEVQKRRKSEENARRATERAEKMAKAHDEAVSRFEEEQRIKAEKQAEQDALGANAVNPKLREKWDNAPKVDGNPDEIVLADGSTLTGHYVLTESGSVTASHDAMQGFEPTEGFPVDENGQSVNDRDYRGDKDAQRIVLDMANGYDSRAMQTPVIVSRDGIVLSGNNRTMSGEIAAMQGTDTAYIEYLNKYGTKYGFTPEQVAGMEHPRLVFVADDALPYTAQTFARFNAQEMKSQSKPEEAIKLGKVVEQALRERKQSAQSEGPGTGSEGPGETADSDRGGEEGSERTGGDAAISRGETNDATNGELAEAVTPTIGPFGEIYTQFKGKAQEAVTFLLAKRSGEAIGALHHKDIGDIDLVWGKEGTGHSDGYGLAKLAKFHPEVLFQLQDILNDMVVTKRSANRVQLESDKYQAAVRLTWDDRKKTWLLTMFEKKNSALDNTTDTDKTLLGNGNDTATPKSTVNSSEGYNRHTTVKQSAETDEESQKPAPSDTTDLSSMNSPTSSSDDKGNTLLSEKQTLEWGNEGELLTLEDIELPEGLSKRRLQNMDIDVRMAYIRTMTEANPFMMVGENGMSREQFEAYVFHAFEEAYKDIAGEFSFKKDRPYLMPIFEHFNAKMKARIEVESTGSGYTITPSTYTNKKQKTSNVWHVKFDRDLTPEEKAALNTFIQEPLEAGRKTSRGWLDSKNGIYIMRSEEAARELAAMLGNKEAIADAQPLSEEDYQAVKKEKKKKSTPKPKNRATLQEIAEDKPSETPAPTDKPAAERGDDDLIGWDEPADGTGNPFGIRAEYTKGRTLTESMKEIGQTNDLGFDVTVGERYRYDGREIEIQAISGANVRWYDRELNRTFEEPAGILEGVEPIEKPRQFKVDDEMREMEDELRSLLGIDDSEGDRGDLFRNPEDFTNKERMQITSLGITYALKYFDQGIISFPDFADKMVRRMGEKIRPWLKAFYGGAREIPGYDHLSFTPADEVKTFDVMNFDKANKDTDPMRTAQGIVAEQRAEEAIAQGQKEIKELRNQTRKENEKQISADTDALATEAEAIGSQAEATAESAKDEREIAAASEKVDEALDKINEQLAILGYFKDDNRIATAERKAVRAGGVLLTTLIEDLNLNVNDLPEGTTPVASDFTEDGGYVRLKLPVKKGYEPMGIDIRFKKTGTGALRLAELTTSLKRGDELSMIFGVDHKRWLMAPLYSELRESIKEQMAKYLPAKESEKSPSYKPADSSKETPKDQPTNQAISEVDVEGLMGAVSVATAQTREDGQEREVKLSEHYKLTEEEETSTDNNASESALKTLSGGKKPTKKSKKQEVKPEQTVGDLFGGLFDEPEKDEKETELRTGTGAGERERGHEPRQNEQMGKGQRHEAEGSERGRMDKRDSVDSVSDQKRGRGLSKQSEVKGDLEPLPESGRKNQRNNRGERGVDYAPKGVDARIKANIEAIELAQRLIESGEGATGEQMGVLRKFSGWGGLGKAFNENGYNPTASRLRELLGDKGYQEAVDSRRSAYYTPAIVIDTMWDVAKALGFKGGNILEGSAGIGNILGQMPKEMSERSNLHAVEIDSTTGNILKLLYPDAKVDIQGFQQTKVANNSIDLAITNVPFITGLKVFDETGDKDLAKKFGHIHDFCIAKNIRKLREGGIGIFITSNGTLDNSKTLRQWITGEGNADVVGAFRLHNKTFGGTGATSDIIVVRKRVNGKRSANAIDVTDITATRTAEYQTHNTRKVKGQEIPIVKELSLTYNRYFAEHPECMGGEMYFGFEQGDTYHPETAGLYPVANHTQEDLLKLWVDELSFKDWGKDEEPFQIKPALTINEKLGEGVKEGSMLLNSAGEICMARKGEAVPMGLNKNKVKGHSKAECFQAYSDIKKALKEVLDYQITNEDNAGLEPLLTELNRAFDRFTGIYGNLHKNTSISFLRNDVDFPSILALETYSEKGDKSGNKVVNVGKTDIFSRRVIEKEKEPQPKDIKDGILASLYEYGGIDADYIAEALGKKREDVRKEIVESGLGFENPASGKMEVSYQYLSGNVREKLHIAEENNEDGRYDQNVRALRQALPMTIPAHLIEFSLGSSWIDHRLYEAFVEEKTGLKIGLTNAGGTWYMKRPWSTYNEKNRAMAVVSKLCGKTIMGDELLEAALTNKTISVSKTEKKWDGTTETISDPEATRLCATKIDELRSEFKDWARGRMQQDSSLSETIERTFNEQLNNYVPLTIPDEFVPTHFGGQVRELHGEKFSLRPHQGRAVVKGTTQPVLLAHEVGTGKTYTLITIAMEMRRLGTARKPMIVVQNATVGQFVESAKKIYPNAKILTIEEADRTAEGRKNFYAKIKYNDWDMIVIPQSVLERIPDSEERELSYVQDIIEEKMKVLEAMREADTDGRSPIVRQAEKEIEEKWERIAELTEAIQGKKKNRDEKREATARQNAEVKALEMLDREVDDVENFDDMGIDALLVDEAHEYKHLGFATAMQRGVKGIDSSYSKKSQGVYLKAQAVLEHNNGRNVIFATGTPISNTAAEIWTFMRYLMPAETMRGYGIYYFDDFVRNFGKISQMVEFDASGKFKETNRFAGYINLPELVRIWSSVADTVLTRDAGGVNDKIPEIEGGKAQDVYLPQTRTLRSVMLYVKSQLAKFEKMSGKEKKLNSHIPLTMFGIAKAAAVDARLVLADAPDEPDSKTNATVRYTLEALEKTKEYNGTVAIFADNYQNKLSGFNLFEDIQEKLISQGVPAEQIVVIKSGMNIKRKLEIFEKVNSGEIRVVLGSTFTLGTGVNIQERLYRVIHMDAPQRPMDYTQRNGRILRQGNLHKDMGLPVSIIRFGVEDSLDVTAYQRLKTKGAIADSIMNGSKMMQNSMENRVLEEEEDTFGDMTAKLSGSQYAILKTQAEREVRNLTAQQKSFETDQIYIHNKLPEIEKYIKGAERRIEIENANLETIGKHWPDGKIRSIRIGNLSFKGISEMEDFIKEQNAKLTKAVEDIKEGKEGHYTSTLRIDIDGVEFIVSSTVEPGVLDSGRKFGVERIVSYSCPTLHIKDSNPNGQRLKAVLEDIEYVVTGESARTGLHYGEDQLVRYKDEAKVLEARKGQEFPHTKELEEAKKRLAEYEAAMKEELEAKEKKYAEMDQSVEMAAGITLTDENGEDSSTSGDGKKYRDGEELSEGERLRAIQSLEPIEVERNELSRGELRSIYGNLPSVEKDGHEIEFYRSAFKKIYKEGGLFGQVVPVLDEVLEQSVLAYSEEDNLGGTTRPDGTIHKAHENIESFDNYIGKVSIDGDEYYVRSTVQNEKGHSGTHSFFVSNVEVYKNPTESRTIPITSRGTTDLNGIVDAKLQQFFERAKAQRDKKEMEAAVERLSQKLRTPIKVISKQEAEAEGYRRKKGWYDRATGAITIVSDNHRNVGDIVDTAVHETVGHNGLRQLFETEEKLNNFLDEAYNISSDKIRQEIDRRTERMMDAEVERLQEQKRKEHEELGEDPESEYYADMAKARIEAETRREQIRRDATEEYAADLGMKIGEEGFERMDAEELTFWGKMKGLLQKALDRLLAGLKLPKMKKWTDKEWSYVLWKSWRNLREGNNRYQGPLAEAEDITRRERSNFGADESRLFRDADMGLEEAITKMKTDAAAANSADFAAKQAAMRAIGGNLSKLRQAMARQREYDITTVKAMTDLSKTLLEAGLLDDLSKYETNRILSAVKNAVGKQDTSKQVQTLMDIMVDNQLRMGANFFGKLLSVKGSHVDARGIEVAGELDPDGQKIAQVVRRSSNMKLDDIENMMSEALNRMGSTDQAVADEATIEYAGLQIAHQYVEEIWESKNEERELRKSIEDYRAERKAESEDAKKSIEEARAHKDAGRMTEQEFITLEHDIEEEERRRKEAFKQYVEATEDAIRQNKIDRAEAYRSLSEPLGGVLGESVERAKAWREAEKHRVEDIHHNANSDMEGRPTNEHHKADRVQKLVNNGALRFVLAPLATFDQMLRMFGRKSVRGEGYLWNRYMRGWVDCTEKEYTGYQNALKELDKKVSEVFGKDMKWGDLLAMERRMPKASVRFWDGGEMRDHELTQGNLLYIYMADKMTDGRMKLRRMGITEDDVERIKDFVDPRFIELADWMQEEFLVGKRNEYNAVHKRMFGASMAAIENYFPLKILANARMENVDVADDTGDNILPATSTGSIIKRKRNNLALDVTGADAFSVILDHIQQMERWASFAEYNRDLNTLLSYKRFRNQVMNMTSAYGAGKILWTNFRNVAAMAAGAYRPPIAPLDKAAVNIAKGVTAAKVSFRVFTALKQFLSMPAYLSDSNPAYLAANIVNPVGAWKWSMENLPLFEKRWKSRMAGDPRLLKSDMDWKMWRSRVVEIAGRIGMSPNAFVDALTVAIGARSMYQTKLAKYKRQGYSLDAARKRAKQDATILFNQTQQSSEGAFLSTMQVDRSWLSVLFTVFRNSSMSYTRQLYDAMRNLSHRLKPGYKGMTEEFMAKQMRRDGIDPDKADQNAKQEYRRGIIRDLVRVGVFGYALQLAWNLGAYLPYLLFGKNGDEKDKMWDDVWNHTMFGSVEGLTGGDVMSAAGEMLLNGEGNPEQLTKEMPLAGDISTILRKMDKDYVSALNDVVNLLVQSGLGFNPQSLTDAAVAVMDYCGEDAQTSRECALLIARIINCPQSQIDKIYFDEIEMSGEDVSQISREILPEAIAERYAEYKAMRNAPLTWKLYSEEEKKAVMDKHKKKAKTTMKERMTSRAMDTRTRDLLETFTDVATRERDINKLRKSAPKEYYAERKALWGSTDMRQHYRVKRYSHDIKRLTEKWLNAKTATEADSLARAMVSARELMLSDIEGYESNK